MFQEILMDFSYASILIVVAYFLRTRVKLFQDFFIPVSVIAGILGLLLGSQVLGQFCPFYIQWSENVSSYANPLLAILFVSQFLTLRLNGRALRTGSIAFIISAAVICIQVLVAMPLVRIFSVPDGLALLPSAGFYGAHGVAGMIAGAFDSVGYWDYNEAFSVGNTFATFGMLWGVIVGIILINYAARKGWLVSSERGKLSKAERTGYIEKNDRKHFMSAISTSTALDPLAVHCAIIGSIIILGYGFLALITKVSFFSSLAIQVPAIIIALVVDVIAAKSKLGDVLDPESLQRIGSTSLEFLIVISLATTNLTVVMQYGGPIIAITIVALVLTTVMCMGLCKIWLKKGWFENSICMIGAWSGSGATGIMLLRIADPDMETDASANYMAQTPFSQLTVQTLFLMVAPYMIVTSSGFNNILLICAGILVACAIAGTILGRKD